jgi:hypothetical protein
LWWVLLMSFWVILDDSLDTDELLAGAGAAALGAFLAELATYQAASQVRVRIEWLVPAMSLPWKAVRDTGLIFMALWRFLALRREPPGGFREQAVRFGPDTVEGKTRRSLIIGGHSVAPASFVLGLDRDRDVMVMHELATREQETTG